ncbi:MAG: hypothetical protein FJ145_08080 [Deltaproteobacteria bacterium]|nr:hypothetical protein [Deltaproteobacteria bacterium]
MKTFGIDGDIRTVRPDGNTDPMIVEEIFARRDIHMAFTDEHWQRFGGHLKDAYTAALSAGTISVRALPGVGNLLALLAQSASFSQGVVTGNLQTGAAIKLRAAGLDGYFSFGAYASDSAYRPDLPRIARERWQAFATRSIDPSQCVIVGDTIKDLAAARANGMKCLLVGTGRYPVEELQYANPDACLADLTDTDEVIDILQSI